MPAPAYMEPNTWPVALLLATGVVLFIVGMLQAIGFQPGMIALSFVLEASFISLAGLGVGTLTGILLGYGMVGEFFSLLNPGENFALSWLQIGGILLLAYPFSLVTTILPAYQASRIYPAEALRYE